MTELRPPIRRELDDATTEGEVQRIWAGIQRRRDLRRSTRGRRNGFLLAVAIGAAALVMLLAWRHLGGKKDSVTGPLLTIDGRLATLLGGAEAGAVDFDDGSRLELAANAELEVLENNGRVWMAVLRVGRITFDVRPEGPRRWTIEAGLATVEVVGTRFELNRTAEALEVNVTRGIVLVRGERVRDRVKRLVAGESFIVREGQDSSAESGERPAVDSPGGQRHGGPTTPDAPNVGGAHGGSADLDDLLAQADAKRRSGDVAGAERILRRILARHARDPRAALAAFTLGKLLFEQRPSDAAQAFSQCLALSPPDALAEDALARLVEAEARSGAMARARATAEAYRLRYPHGRWLDALKQWSDAY